MVRRRANGDDDHPLSCDLRPQAGLTEVLKLADLEPRGAMAPIGAPLPDLAGRTDVHDLVVRFYREIVFDDLLEPVFGEVAEVDWAAHIPRVVDYWCRVLFGHPGYNGYLLGAHQRVHALQAFEGELFDRWYLLFVATVDQSWAGPTADKAKAHAARIAAVLARRLIGLDWLIPAHPVCDDRRAQPAPSSR